MDTANLKTIDDPEDELLDHLCDQHVILESFRRDPQYNSWYSNSITRMYEEFVTKAQTLGDDDLLLMNPRKPFSLLNTVLVRTDSAAPCYNRYIKHGAGWKLEERNISVNDIEARPLNADEYTRLADTLFGSMISTLPTQRSRTYLQWLWQSSRRNVDRTMIALRILRPDTWQNYLEIPRLYALDVDTDWAYLAERTAEETGIPRAALIMLPAAIPVLEERLAILRAMREVINKDMSPYGFRNLLEPYRHVGSRANPLMWTHWMRD